MEMELKIRYQIISGRNNQNNTSDYDDSESDESGDDHMQSYDGFTGEIRIREVIYITLD